MSNKPKKTEAETEAPAVEASAVEAPGHTDLMVPPETIDKVFDELITPEGNTPKAAAFMSDDPNEVVKAVQAALPEVKAEEPKASVPAVAKVAPMSEKTHLEMQRGVEVISKYR